MKITILPVCPSKMEGIRLIIRIGTVSELSNYYIQFNYFTQFNDLGEQKLKRHHC